MRNKFKKMALVIALNTLLFSQITGASSLEETFSSITSTTVDAGLYRSKTRSTATLGSFSARVPTTTISLVSITPPRFSGGCGGISAHFGGFSFINGIDFQNLVTNITQNALGLVLHLAIKVGCEVCQTVLSHIEKAAQFAAELSTTSCQAAQSMLELVNAEQLCRVGGGLSAKAGLSEDPTDAVKACENEIDSWDTYQDLRDNDDKTGNDKPKKPLQDCGADKSNIPWCVLKATQLIPTDDASPPVPLTIDAIGDDMTKLRKRAFAEIIMNMLPHASNIQNTLSDEVESGRQGFANNEAAMKQIYTMATCGLKEPSAQSNLTHKTEVTNILKTHCEFHWSSPEPLNINVCKEDDLVECLSTVPLPISEWANTREFFDDGGMYGIITDHLYSIYNKVNTRQRLTDPDRALIASAPIPLHQLLNLSASYPELMSGLIEPASIYLADILVEQYLNDMLTKMAEKMALKNIPTEEISTLKRTISEVGVMLRNNNLKLMANSAHTADREFRKSLAIEVEQYQRLLYSDVASSHIGANAKAQSLIYNYTAKANQVEAGDTTP